MHPSGEPFTSQVKFILERALSLVSTETLSVSVSLKDKAALPLDWLYAILLRVSMGSPLSKLLEVVESTRATKSSINIDSGSVSSILVPYGLASLSWLLYDLDER